VAVERLIAGQAFHKTVQSAFLTGLAGASGYPERQWRLLGGRRGRVDLAAALLISGQRARPGRAGAGAGSLRTRPPR
jgi:hypothetical protein